MEFCKFKLNGAVWYGIPATLKEGVAKVLTSKGYINVPCSLLCEVDKLHNPILYKKLSGQLFADTMLS